MSLIPNFDFANAGHERGLVSARFLTAVHVRRAAVIEQQAWDVPRECTFVAWADAQHSLVLREADGDWSAYFQVDGVDVALNKGGRSLRAVCAAAQHDPIRQVLGRLRAAWPAVQPDAEQLWMRFWYLGPHGPVSERRVLAAPTWAEIAANYPDALRPALEHLLCQFRPSASGQLLLWHGPPGTGKTWALRALAREWQPWCDTHFIVDSDNLFGKEPAYLIQVMLAADAEAEATDPDRERWRLLILEDAGDLMTVDARERVGQGLSRLLNLVDGLLGQGLRLLVLITTNEPFGKIHPAVARSGRCAARLEFVPFTVDESAHWLLTHALAPDDVQERRTLADLYAQVRADRPVPRPASVGFAAREAC